MNVRATPNSLHKMVRNFTRTKRPLVYTHLTMNRSEALTVRMTPCQVKMNQFNEMKFFTFDSSRAFVVRHSTTTTTTMKKQHSNACTRRMEWNSEEKTQKCVTTGHSDMHHPHRPCLHALLLLLLIQSVAPFRPPIRYLRHQH